MQKAVILLSGGLDSLVATRLAMQNAKVVAAINCDYGQRSRMREFEAASLMCAEWEIELMRIDLPWLGEMTATALVDRSRKLPTTSPDSLDEGAEARAKSVWVPNRNGVFVAAAAALAESLSADTIVMGLNAEEAATFPDNSKDFMEASNAVLSLSTLSGVRLESPTLQMTKLEIAKKFVELEIPPDNLWCCYEGGEKLCGRCESCARSVRAFKSIGSWELVSHRFEFQPD